MNGRHVSACLATALLLISASAQAQTDTSPAPDPAEGHPLAIRTGAGFNAGNVHGTSLLRADASLGVAFDFTRWMTVYTDLHFGTTRFGYRGGLVDGLAVDGQLWSYFDVSMSVGTAFHVLRRGPFTLDLYGEFEASLANTSPHLESLRITTPQGTYDVGPYAAANSTPTLAWYRLALGTTLRVRWGFAEPRLTIAFEDLHGSMDLRLNDDSRDTLARLGYDPTAIERPHEITFFRVALMPGIDFRLGPRDTLGITGVIAPASDATTYGAATMYSHRF
ncbi:MAG: hypothetical protein RL272_77 [Candidatus Parcubacteria bacterium]|jgi:hypothetical protein